MKTTGDEWHEFDLHIHTPYSKETEYGGHDRTETWDRFISELESLRSECRVIGINDYWVLDGYNRVKLEKDRGRLRNIETIIPIVELRLKQGVTRNGVTNMHIAFDPAVKTEDIQSKFLNQLYDDYDYDGKTRRLYYQNESDLIFLGKQINSLNFMGGKSDVQVGKDSFSVDIKKIEELLRQEEFHGNFLTFIGGVEWKELRKAQIPEKLSLVRSMDGVFVASPDEEAFRAMERSVEEFASCPVIHGSDAHRFNDGRESVRYLGAGRMWARTNRSFAGLKFAIKNKRERLSYGTPREIVAKANSNILQEISVGASDDGPVFNYDFKLNPGYVAVIGNRGQGKSAILDWISFAGGADRDLSFFSFLNGTRYSNNKNYNAVATARWLDQSETTREWKKKPETVGARVDYFPQSFLDKICANDPGNAQGDELKNLIYDIVFRCIDDTHGHDNLDSLLADSFTQASELKDARAKIYDLASNLSREYERIRRIKGYDLAQVRKRLEQQISEIEGRGTLSDGVDEGAVTLQRQEVEASRDEGTERLRVLEEAERELTLSQFEVDSYLQKLGPAMEEAESLFLGVSRAAGGNVIEERHFVDGLLGKIDEFSSQIAETYQMFISSIGSYRREAADQQAQLNELLRELTSREAASLEETQLADRLKDLRNGPTVPDSDRWSVDGVRELELELNSAERDAENIISELECVSRNIAELVTAQVGGYDRFIRDSIAGSIVEFDKLAFVPWIENISPELEVMKRLDRTRTGSRRILECLAEGYSSVMDSGALNLGALEGEYFPKIREVLDVVKARPRDELLRASENAELGIAGIISDMYSFPNLRAAVTVGLNGFPLRSLSPGQRGLVLLLFVLYVDRSSNVLVFDQPEDNLDNVSIRSLLLPAIETARLRRQIIVVSHNANIGVLGDPDQVICMSIENGVFSGRSGSLFDDDIRSSALETLEGAEEAFRARSVRYGLSIS